MQQTSGQERNNKLNFFREVLHGVGADGVGVKFPIFAVNCCCCLPFSFRRSRESEEKGEKCVKKGKNALKKGKITPTPSAPTPLRTSQFLWPKMARLGPRFRPPKSSRKSLCRSLFCVLSQEMRHINIFSGGPEWGFWVGAKKFMLKKLMGFFCPFSTLELEPLLRRSPQKRQNLSSKISFLKPL